MIPEFKVRMVGGWEVFSFNEVFSFLVESIQIKKNNITHLTVSQLYMIYEYRIDRMGPKNNV